MTSTTVKHYDEQHDDAVDNSPQELDDFPQGMLASPTRVRL
jgi:hypothetical protein